MDEVLPAGSLFAGRYRVDQLLGSGAQKRSYLAWDTKAGRPVALAVLSADAEPTVGQHEAALLARVGPHDNIVTLYDFGVEDGCQFLALEYLPGGELRDHCQSGQYEGGRVPLSEFFRWARQLCRAISQIHQYRIVHRDISATNIWLDARHVTHLGDFDTAFYLEDPQMTAQDFSTTEGYPAPELLGGAAGDIRTDMYSLGAVFYELLVGWDLQHCPCIPRRPLNRAMTFQPVWMTWSCPCSHMTRNIALQALTLCSQRCARSSQRRTLKR